MSKNDKPLARQSGVTQASLVRKARALLAYKPADVSPQRRVQRRYTMRLWSVRHSRFLEWFYARFADVFLTLHPVWNAIGYRRAEKPVKFVERHVKGFMFDCRMCGQCILSSTGMSCPMNCPKQLRNGPCGGVRANGNCEVEPDMPCVWVKAWEGAQKMRNHDAILAVQKPVDQSLRETSAWLRVTATAAAEREKARETA
ncbi:methylenetetrahydrofolate reductase C-terminal domain-containing protein [Chelativorans xinjiangense]|uniref:methylenetetrahydrofolate reductase C-terminal domain-containing protein n=1 Tax=Chelativorans xinjiangense TaxID=2681485 RepID=UPI00135A6B62|nr:methylenetetrahydrofolate reductase C-terminal domain-containing protein [Chelativorans xinjiangense]